MLNYEKIAVEKLGQNFLRKLKAVSKKIKIPYQWLLGVIYSESGFNPKAINYNQNSTVDVGLIQFNTITAQQLGISTNDILKLNATEQLKLIERHYKPIAGKIKTFGDLYAYNHSLQFFYNPSLQEVKNFKAKVTNRYLKDTGINPNFYKYYTLVQNLLIALIVFCIIYFIIFRK